MTAFRFNRHQSCECLIGATEESSRLSHEASITSARKTDDWGRPDQLNTGEPFGKAAKLLRCSECRELLCLRVGNLSATEAQEILLAAEFIFQHPTDREKLTPEERKAKDAERRRDAEQALLEHRLALEAFHKNRERRRAERLAREASARRLRWEEE